jgi:hypothetical protein
MPHIPGKYLINTKCVCYVSGGVESYMWRLLSILICETAGKVNYVVTQSVKKSPRHILPEYNRKILKHLFNSKCNCKK